MDYSTPGVYIREVDSGPKPIASVATSVPGFLGLFDFSPPDDAIAIAGSDGARQIQTIHHPPNPALARFPGMVQRIEHGMA